MSTSPLRAGQPRGAPARILSRNVARQLRRFHRSNQTVATHVAAGHPRLAGLAFSFPALLHVLAAQRRGIAHEAVREAVIAGEPLARIAARAALPWWARKLPPECFREAIPPLPDGEMFRRRIGNHLPQAGRYADAWVKMVSSAAQWAGEDFALWCASHKLHVMPKQSWEQYKFRLMALWAWHSLHPGGRAHWLIETAWTPQMSPTAAGDAASIWLESIHTELGFAERPALPGLRPAAVDGYDFVPLDSCDEVLAEAAEMKNCLRSFGDVIGSGMLSFWSIRWRGKRIAVFSVFRSHHHPMPHIGELKVAGNSNAPVDVWLAAARWLTEQDLLKLTAERPLALPRRPALPAWQSLWKPFWLSHRRIPQGLPVAVPGAIWDLHARGVQML